MAKRNIIFFSLFLLILFCLFVSFFWKVYDATYHNFYNAYRCVTRIERSNLWITKITKIHGDSFWRNDQWNNEMEYFIFKVVVHSMISERSVFDQIESSVVLGHSADSLMELGNGGLIRG